MEQTSLDLKAPSPGRRVLDMRESFNLISLIVAEYGAKRLDDIEFAKYAAGKLGFPVSQSHVAHARRKFDIPATRTVVLDEKRRPQGRMAALEASLLDLTTRVQYLEEHLTVLLRERAARSNGRG